MKLKLITKINTKADPEKACYLQLLVNGEPIIEGPEETAMEEMTEFYRQLNKTKIEWELEKGKIVYV